MPEDNALDMGFEPSVLADEFDAWVARASIDDINAALMSVRRADQFGVFALHGAFRALFEGNSFFHLRFMSPDVLAERVANVDRFVTGPTRFLDLRRMLPELYEMWERLSRAAAEAPGTAWEKARSIITQEVTDLAGPGELDALRYSRRFARAHATDQVVREMLYEWATRIIRRKEPPDEAARRAARGDMPLAEVVELWTQRFHEPYYIWSPIRGERAVCDGIIGRMADAFDLSGFEFWTDPAVERFAEGPVDGMNADDALWLFWLLYGTNRPLRAVNPRTLFAWGWAFSRLGMGTEHPWSSLRGTGEDGRPVYERSVVVAASFLYAASRTVSFGIEPQLAEAAATFLRQCQAPSGGWPAYVGGELMALSTVMAAWALHSYGLGDDEVSRALGWLEANAEPSGGWATNPGPWRFPYVLLNVAILELHEDVQRQAEQRLLMEEAVTDHPRRFRVALSFPGEARADVVKPVADALVDTFGFSEVFYDRHFEAELARPNLDTYLQNIYRTDSDLLVIFLGADYQSKDWCGLEWRAIRDIIKERDDDRVMMMRLDNGVVDGTFGIDGYIDVNGRGARELADLVVQRHRMI